MLQIIPWLLWKASYDLFVLYGLMQVRMDLERKTEGLNLHVQGHCFNHEFPVLFPYNMHSAFIHKQG